MPNTETLHVEDKALSEMYQADKATLSPEDEAAYRELIDGQRAAHQTTHIEVRGRENAPETIQVRSIGDAALHNPMAVHSETWLSERK